MATGKECSVDHGVESHAQGEVTARCIQFTDGVDVVLVDTPGFDDTHRSDEEILKPIADWLRGASRLSAVLYLHNISENRISSKHHKGLSMLRKLLQDIYDKIIIVTTMWPETADDNENTYASREKDLRLDDWAVMVAGGSVTLRFRSTQKPAWSIIDHIVAVESERHWIWVQNRLTQKGDKLPSGGVGQQYREQIQNFVEKQKSLMIKMKNASAQETMDFTLVSSLQAEVMKLQEEQAELEEGDKNSSETGVSAFRKVCQQEGVDLVPVVPPRPVSNHSQGEGKGIKAGQTPHDTEIPIFKRIRQFFRRGFRTN